MNSLLSVTDKLFEQMPYSELSEEIKEKINTAFKAEYTNLIDSGQNQMQALDTIMQKYGTLESAAQFAGIDRKTLCELKADNNTFEKKSFHKTVLIIKLLSALTALSISGAVVSLIQGIVMLEPSYLISIAVTLTMAYVFFRSYRKNCSKLDFARICLSTSQKDQLEIYCDRHKKRVINSLFILLIFTVNYFTVWERSLIANLTSDETIVLITSRANSFAVGVFLFLYCKFVVHFFLNGVCRKQRDKFKIYTKKTANICGSFLCCALTVTLILKLFIRDPFPVLYILTALFIIIGLIINYKKRVSVVIKNIRINKTRIVAFSIVILLFLTVNTMKKDVYVLEPYIMKTAQITHSDHNITYNDSTGTYTISAGSDDFKILHLTDIHLGGSVNSSYKDFQALEACRKLIAHTQPDFVIVTGDLVFPMGIMSFSLNNEAPVRQFASFMRNIGVPWAFTYGNHDTESIATGSKEDIDDLYRSLSFKNSGNLLYPYIQPEITGRNNQIIKLINNDGSIRQALFLIDSNDYISDKVNDYDYIHDDQVMWYKQQVLLLNMQENRTVPSMLFFHVPLQEYRTAYELYENGSSQVNYYFGKIGETMINKICCSDHPSRLFDTAVSLGSTRAMFCGHDHYNNISLEYKNIRLTYGMSIDYLAMPGIQNKTEQRGAELITVHSNSEFDIEQVRLTDIE